MSEISTDALLLSAKAHDASHYSLTPEEVATITNASDMSRFLAVKNRDRKHLTFRSGGTSLSGQAVTDGSLVDTRTGFRGIEIRENGAVVVVEPGVTIREINARLKAYGYKLGPDPASEIAATIGGVLANNSSGMVCGTTENSYQTIISMKIVFVDGYILDTSSPEAENNFREHQPEIFDAIVRERNLIQSQPHLSTEIKRQFQIKNTMGYSLNAFVDFQNPIDILVHLLIGSEGTLGFIAEATLRTIPLKAHASTDLYLFDSLHAANSSLELIVAQKPAAIELLDATSLRVSQRSKKVLPEIAGLGIDTQAALIVEYQESSENLLREVSARAHQNISTQSGINPLLSTEALGPRGDLWHLRKGLYTSVAGSRPAGTTALLEDIAVPVGALATTCEALNSLFNKYSYRDSVIFGHAKDGNIHFMLSEDFSNPASADRYARFSDEMVDLVLAENGTLKAEHGTGRVMSPFVERQFGAELYAVMVRLKNAFDPHAILNRDVIITHNQNVHIENLKQFTRVADEEIDKCVECGFCESVCPSKFLTLTPRQRIIAQRSIEEARNSNNLALASELEKSIGYYIESTCAADGMCSLSCPLGINTGDFVKRLRSEESSTTSQFLWETLARNWRSFLAINRFALSIYNLAPRTFAPLSKLLHKFVSAVPAVNGSSIATGKKRRSLVNVDPEVIYIPSCMNEMFESTESAFLSLCQKAGIKVVIPDEISSMCCGTPWKSKGMNQGRKHIDEFTNDSLAKYGDLPVVTDNSSCHEGFIAQLGSERVISATEYIEKFIVNQLSITQVNDVVLHPTCSTEKNDGSLSLISLANKAARDVIVPPNWGCCGFAGDRGFLRPELTQSATREEAVYVNSLKESIYISNNTTCELAMSQATGKQYISIITLLDKISR